MPLKVKELRNRADDSARNNLMHEQEGIRFTAPLSGQHFEHLLTTISSLYEKNKNQLGLVLDFWCPPDGNTGVVERFPQRQVNKTQNHTLVSRAIIKSFFFLMAF